jgi:hypothetical protein
VDHQRQTVEALGVMVSILGHGTEDISEVDTDSDSHWDEDGGLPTVISMTHQQLVGIGSDELPNFPWDPGVHLVSRFASSYEGPGCAREQHTSLLDYFERACWDLFYEARQVLPIDTRD